MAFKYATDYLTPITADVKVGAFSSFQTGHAFSNAYTDYSKPWSEWWGGFSDQSTHTVDFTFSWSFDVIIILGANFPKINYNSTDYNLGYNYALGRYNGFLYIGTKSSPLSFTIPAYTTEEGFFIMKGIMLGAQLTLAKNPSYPMTKQVLQPSREITLESNHNKMAKRGRRNHIIELKRKGTSYSNSEDLRELKQSIGFNPFVIFENLGDDSQTFLVRRLEDFQYQEVGHKNYEDILRLEEIA